MPDTKTNKRRLKKQLNSKTRKLIQTMNPEQINFIYLGKTNLLKKFIAKMTKRKMVKSIKHRRIHQFHIPGVKNVTKILQTIRTK